MRGGAGSEKANDKHSKHSMSKHHLDHDFLALSVCSLSVSNKADPLGTCIMSDTEPIIKPDDKTSRYLVWAI